MSHELSTTDQDASDALWYNRSNVVYPRVLEGPFLHREVAESAARRRSNETDPWQLYAPLSPLGAAQDTVAMARETEAPLTPAEGERIADEATREAQRKGVRTTGATLETIAPVEPVPVPGVEVTAERTTLYDLAHQLMGASPGPALAERGARSEQLARRYERAAEAQRQGLTDVQETAKAQEHARAEAKPAPLTLPGAPSTAARPFLSPGESVLSQIQTAILGVGQVGMGIAGLKGRGHAIAAMSALKGAAEGWQAGDADRVQRSLAEWQTHAKKLLAEHQAAREAFDDLLTDQKMAMDTKLASIRITAEIAGNEGLAEAARLGNLDEIIKYGEHQQTLGAHLLDAATRLKQYETTQARLLDQARRLEEYRAKSLGLRERGMKLREQMAASVQKLEAEDFALGQKLLQIDTLEGAVDRSSKKGIIPKGATKADQLKAALALQTSFGDEEVAADIETIKRVGTALLVGSEIASGLSPSVARLKVIGEAEAAGATAIPKSFWDRWFERQRSGFKDRQKMVRDRLRAIPGYTPRTESSEEPAESERFEVVE